MKVGWHSLHPHIVVSSPQGGRIYLVLIRSVRLLPRGIHAVIDLHHVVSSSSVRRLALLPATGSSDREVVNDSWTVFTRCENVAHARLVYIKATQLRYFSFILLPLVKFQMLRCTFFVSLKRLLLLRDRVHLLGQLGVHLQRERLLHAIARLHYFLIR